MIKSHHAVYNKNIKYPITGGPCMEAGGLEVDDEPPDAVVSHPVVFQGRLLAKILVQLILDLFQETGKASLVDGEGRLHCQRGHRGHAHGALSVLVATITSIVQAWGILGALGRSGKGEAVHRECRGRPHWPRLSPAVSLISVGFLASGGPIRGPCIPLSK